MKHRMTIGALSGLAALVALLVPMTAAGQGGGAPGQGDGVAITMNSMAVDTATPGEATVTVNITNDGTASIEVDLNVIALGDCAGDVFVCDVYDCTREGVGSVDGFTLDAGASADFSVTLPLAAGDYVFRARITGSKKKAEDQKWGVQSATVV